MAAEAFIEAVHFSAASLLITFFQIIFLRLRR